MKVYSTKLTLVLLGRRPPSVAEARSPAALGRRGSVALGRRGSVAEARSPAALGRRGSVAGRRGSVAGRPRPPRLGRRPPSVAEARSPATLGRRGSVAGHPRSPRLGRGSVDMKTACLLTSLCMWPSVATEGHRASATTEGHRASATRGPPSLGDPRATEPRPPSLGHRGRPRATFAEGHLRRGSVAEARSPAALGADITEVSTREGDALLPTVVEPRLRLELVEAPPSSGWMRLSCVSRGGQPKPSGLEWQTPNGTVIPAEEAPPAASSDSDGRYSISQTVKVTEPGSYTCLARQQGVHPAVRDTIRVFGSVNWQSLTGDRGEHRNQIKNGAGIPAVFTNLGDTDTEVFTREGEDTILPCGLGSPVNLKDEVLGLGSGSRTLHSTVAYCSSGIVTQPYTCWLINIVSVLTSHSGSVAFRGVAVLFPLPVRPNLPAVVRFSPRLPGLLVQSLLAVKCTASWTTCSGLRLGVPACVFEC
ncbi:unnamed protein product [Boreogadus saida]